VIGAACRARRMGVAFRPDRRQHDPARRHAPLKGVLSTACRHAASETDHIWGCLLCRDSQAVCRLSGCTEEGAVSRQA
jgi:hypothetical protein